MRYNKYITIVVLVAYTLLLNSDLYGKSYSGYTVHEQFQTSTKRAPSQPEYILEQMDNASGISHSSVNTVFQDSDNLLWLGTWDGLNRYDGRTFKIFRPELNNPSSLSNQVILKVTEDEQGNIWVLTMHGINRYDKHLGKFDRFYFSKKDKVALTDTEFNMALSPNKRLFAYAREWGIGVYDGSTFQKIWEDSLLGMPIVQMRFLDKNTLLVLDTSGQLSRLQLQEETGIIRAMGYSRLVGGVDDFEILGNGAVLVVDVEGRPSILSIDHKGSQKLDIDRPCSIIGRVQRGVVVSTGVDHYLVGRDNKPFVPKWLERLKGNKLTSLFHGSEDIYWAATDGKGVFMVHPNNKHFKGVSSSQVPDFEGTIVRAFLQMPDSSLWVGTKGKGLFRFPSNFFDKEDNGRRYRNFNQSNSAIDNAVYSLLLTKDSLLLIGSDGPGISLYDLKKERLMGWGEVQGVPRQPRFKSVYALYQDKDGLIWAGTSGYGLVRIKLKRTDNGIALDSFGQYVGNLGRQGEISSNIIYAIIPRDDRSLWVGTRLGGLNLFDKQKGSFEVYRHEEGNKNSLSNNDILCMHKASNGDLWIGTSFGLNVYREEGNFVRYTVNEGLPSNTIHGITSDTSGNLWVSTNYGLSKLDVEEQRFYNYTKEEGLQDNEFGDGAAYTGLNYIFMGGRKGFNYFIPNEIRFSDKVPNLFIDRIIGQDGSEPYYQNLVISPHQASAPVIELKHNQNFLNVEFSALTFINNKKCSYAYQLKQFDPEWNQIGARTNLSFTNIPAGSYSLWLKWTNGDGVWSEPVEAAQFKIAPIFWRSGLALMLYALLFTLFVLFVYGYYQKKQSLQRSILIRKQEEKAHENKLDFFTNVAHELQTPLTLMVAPVQRLGESGFFDAKTRKYFEMVKKNTSRLLFLTHQILEFRKAEDGHLNVEKEYFDLVSLVEQIAELFDELALKKNIDYKVELPENLMGWFDKDLVEKIIFNLLSNAFKYTPVKGFIALDVKIVGLKGEKSLELNITNSGEGIPKEKLNRIFEKFYLLDRDKEVGANMFRTGIGLAYTKKMVELLEGNISVASSPHKATTFRVNFPCGHGGANHTDMVAKSFTLSPPLKNMAGQAKEENEVGLVNHKLDALDQHTVSGHKYILLVEDDPEVQELLVELLGDRYYLRMATNGDDALEKIKIREPDLIISDVMMPVMDGVELCKRIKENLDTCHIPFIMLTAKDSIEHKLEGIESGANDYISKPFYPDYLLLRIQKLLEEREYIQKHFSQESPFEDLIGEDTADKDRVFIEQLIDLVNNNLDSDRLQSSFLEQELGLSASQLYRKTKELLGFSPGDLIRTMRLRHASQLLKKTNLTVSEVCFRSGFNNRSYFYREFKKLYYKTPKDYQLDHKKNTS
ncbi:hybrid sensor histidine kinase/response regulator transcription factor [Pseudozobellia thermophila]|uniref:histidine kinase n=1 Tax=Pseudozobellia thermophila TaxID=192903 RepID=A0A1M6GAR4_9FLAO|nr:two-component regulator propeller domain-containing protein [Pseudozobellia thermophila]SHJ07063.1 Signal transduction histidine kinase [Pseudozobellia thermophila]